MRSDWFVAITNTNCERRATQGLEDVGFEVWWPIRVVDVRVGPARERRPREFPVFPGYVFVRSTGISIPPRRRIVGVENDRAVEVVEPVSGGWQRMIGIDGLRAVLCDLSTMAPCRVADVEVQRVRTQLAPLAQSQATVTLPIGSPVVITEGPLAGLRGLLTAIMSGGAAEVAMDLLGRSTATKIDYSKLEKVG